MLPRVPRRVCVCWISRPPCTGRPTWSSSTSRPLASTSSPATRCGTRWTGSARTAPLNREGTVAGLTRTLPATIRFGLPLRATRGEDGRFLIETFGLQKDLHTLLGWAQDYAMGLAELEAGPTRLDDVFRAIGNA